MSQRRSLRLRDICQKLQSDYRKNSKLPSVIDEDKNYDDLDSEESEKRNDVIDKESDSDDDVSPYSDISQAQADKVNGELVA